jgi:hypothetical protein
VSHPPKKLLDQVRDAIRLKHYSIRTGLKQPALSPSTPLGVNADVPSVAEGACPEQGRRGLP